MNKRSDQGFFQNWRKRWVMLSDRLLYYYVDANATNPNGAFMHTGTSTHTLVCGA